MRVLMLAASYAPVVGGLQTQTHGLARKLAERGHQVQVLTNRYPRQLPGSEALDGIRVRRLLFLKPDLKDLRRGKPGVFLASLILYPITLLYLYWLMEYYQPEVVNIHFPDAQIRHALWLRKRFDFRLVVSLHGHEVERWFREEVECERKAERLVALKSFRLLLRESDAVVACSQYVLAKAIQIEALVERKGRVIPNAIDAKRFEDRSSYPHPRDYLLALGRLTRSKGFDMLLEAYAGVISAYPDVCLVLAGEGEGHRSLEDQAEALGLDHRVVFLGRATPQQVVRLMNGCLFVVVPSREEGFGLVALEAFAAGKAVLGTRVGGLPDLLEVFGCETVEPTCDGIRAGILRWLAQPGKVMAIGQQCREVAARYDWDRTIDEYERVL